MKKRIFGIFLLVLLSFVFVVGGLKGNAEATASDYLNETNWKNLPGYQYKTSGVLAENDEKFPAEVTFGENQSDIGINMKLKGYYASGTGDKDGNMYSGLVYKNKVSIEDFSVMFTVKKQGASTNASPADDGWIGIGFMKECNLWSTTSTDINMGAIALIRPSSRGLICYFHEIAASGDYKISNFAKGTSVSVELDTLPSFEGSTIRLRIEKEANPSGDKYYLVMEQIDFDTMEVIGSKKSRNPLECPEIYADSNMEGYLAISASTDNFDKEWDLSIKEINGVMIGTKKDATPLTPTERATNIYDLINELDIYTYFELDGTLSDEGKEFYSPKNKTINDLITKLSVELYSMDSETSRILASLDMVSGNFDSIEQYVLFLNECKDALIENYENIETDILIENINNAVASLPKLEDVSLANEQLTLNIINNLQVYYNDMKERTIIKYGEENYNKLWNDIILKYSDKLDDLKITKLISLVDELKNSITESNYASMALSLVPAEKIYESLIEKMDDIEARKPEQYSKITEAVDCMNTRRGELNNIKETKKREVEEIEKGALVAYEIYYLPNPVKASDIESLFNILNKYNELSLATRKLINGSESLIDACIKALDLNIENAPNENEITKENYIVNSYDTLITNLNNYYSIIESTDGADLTKLTLASKLTKLVGKISSLKNPFSTLPVSYDAINVNEALEIQFVSLFNNYFGRNYTVTTNYGEVDMMSETVKLSFDKAGTYTVNVTITDNDYQDTVANTFTVTVNGGENNKDKGCKSNLSMVSVLLAPVLIAIAYRRKKECQ